MKEKTSTNSLGTFVMRRYDERRDFVCDRCLQPKSAKIEVEWHDSAADRTKTICNGCFGRLSIENEE
jgi:hypothetical protein